jgi:hypothetical protein
MDTDGLESEGVYVGTTNGGHANDLGRRWMDARPASADPRRNSGSALGPGDVNRRRGESMPAIRR